MASTETAWPVQRLMRHWVVHFFNAHDASAGRQILTPGYALRVGDQTITGRDAQYLPAVQGQWDQFPGLGMTVHRVLVGADQIALEFTEHGASGGPGGRVACWSGVALYRGNGRQFTACVAQEDYLARHRQLKSGIADPVGPPCAAPWDTLAQDADPRAESVVRRWLERPWPSARADVRCDDEHIAGVAPLAFDVHSTEVTDLFSAANGVAFHVVQTGRYLGGLAGVPASTRPSVLYCAGVVSVQGDEVVAGRVIRDRAGLRRSLLSP